MTTIIEVFHENFREQEAKLLLALSQYKSIAFDTEFPGMIDQTPRDADDNLRYRDLKSNVERTKLIQVGFTVFDSSTGIIAGVWQFNMSGFNPAFHEQSPDSIRFLENNGMDFSANLAHGVRMGQFVAMLRKIREGYGSTIQWVTFHGLYDIAYLLVALARNRRLPKEIGGFAKFAGDFFCGGIFDLKHMAGDQFNYMRLEKLAMEVGETRDCGRAHQAGSDSLLTAKVFVRAVRMMRDSGKCLESQKGRLYGITTVPIASSMVAANYSYPSSSRGYAYGIPFRYPAASTTRCYAYGVPFPCVIVPSFTCHRLLI